MIMMMIVRRMCAGYEFVMVMMRTMMIMMMMMMMTIVIIMVAAMMMHSEASTRLFHSIHQAILSEQPSLHRLSVTFSIGWGCDALLVVVVVVCALQTGERLVHEEDNNIKIRNLTGKLMGKERRRNEVDENKKEKDMKEA